MKRILLATSALALALGAITAVPATSIAPIGGTYPWNCAGNGTAVSGGQMTYDSTTVTANAAVSDGLPGVMVCRNTDNNYYVVMLGLYNATSPGLTEAMGATYGAKTYTVTFPVQSGDSTTIADAIGSISEYTVTNGTARVVITPIEASTVFGNERPAGCNPPADPVTGNYKAECAENAITGKASSSGKYARFSVRFDRGWASLAGMYVSASADLFEVKLSGSCPTATSSGGFTDGSSSDGGANRPSGLRESVETNLIVNLLGPHLTESGALNQGSLTAVIPSATVQACFGAAPDEMATNFAMTRTEGGTTEPVTTGGSGGLKYTISSTAAGLVISVPTVTFSQPTYNLKFTKQASATATDSANESTSAGTIAGVKVKGAKGSAIATFKKSNKVKSYSAKAQLASGKGAMKKGSCKVKGSNVTCVVKKLKKGTWSMQITSTLKAGGVGPSVMKTGINVK